MFEQLFRSLALGDRKAFDEVFPTCYEKLRYLAFGILRDQEGAKDAVNEVLEKVLKLNEAGELDSIKDPDGWIVTVARNHCLSQARRDSNRARLRRRNIEPFLKTEISSQVLAPLILADVKNCLAAAMTVKEGSVWQLLTVEYLDRPDICEQLEITDNRLRAYISEIKKKLLKCIGNE